MKNFILTIIVLFILLNVVGYFLSPERDEKKRKVQMKQQPTELTQ